MHLEMAAALDLMKSSADEVGVRNEAVDPSQTLEEVDERPGVQLGEHAARRGTHGRVVLRGELPLGCAVECEPVGALRTRELGEDLVEDALRQEVVKDDVGVRV